MGVLRKAWIPGLLLAGILLLAYGITRLTNLTLLPIFTDEAIYIRWSQIGANDAAWRFISLTDGKQPMYTWLAMVSLKVFTDPLFAGRFVSVLAGLGSITGMWFLARELFGKKVAWWASFLYLIYPFALMYDRLALYDSLVATFSIWNLYIAILLVRHVRLDLALILGLTLGAGMLNKTSGFLSLYLLPATLLLFPLGEKRLVRRFMKWVGLVLIAAILSQVVYSVLRLSPLFHMVSQKNAVFVYPLQEWLEHPIEFFVGNMKGVVDWLFGYMTLPMMIAAFMPLVAFWNKPKEKLLLYAWWIAPFVGLALFARVLYPRFILFMTIPLLVLSAVTLEWIFRTTKSRLWKAALGIFFLGLMIRADYYIITNPLYAPIPAADRGQIIDNWPSGWGVSEVNAFLAREAVGKKIAVYTEGTFGLFPYAIEIYHITNSNIEIHGIWPLPEDMPEEILASVRAKPTYFVLNQDQEPPERWTLTLVAEYQKGTRVDRKLRLYKVELPPPPVKRK